jgi:hypothetical protein
VWLVQLVALSLQRHSLQVKPQQQQELRNSSWLVFLSACGGRQLAYASSRHRKLRRMHESFLQRTASCMPGAADLAHLLLVCCCCCLLLTHLHLRARLGLLLLACLQSQHRTHSTQKVHLQQGILCQQCSCGPWLGCCPSAACSHSSTDVLQ